MRFMILVFMATLIFTVLLKTSAADSSRRIELNVDLQSADKDSSRISFDLESSYSVDEGDDILVPVSIYRGSTLKRTVYVWTEDEEGKRISSKSKHSLPERFTEYNVSASINFSGCHPSGDYIIVVEGLGLNVAEKVFLEFPGCGMENISSGGEISFSVINSGHRVVSGESFTTRIIMSNPTGDFLDVDAWSYVYKGSVCLSGDREQNLKTVNLPEASNVEFDLENTVRAEQGNYTLKIKLLRSDRKTPVEFNIPVTVVGGNRSEDAGSDVVKEDLMLEDDSAQVSANISKASKRSLFDSIIPKDDAVVYESSSAKARKITVYFVIFALALVLVALVLKRL